MFGSIDIWMLHQVQFLRKRKVYSEKDSLIVCVSCREVSKKSINTKPHQVRTFPRIPLIALRLFLVLSRFKNSSNGFLGILTHQY